MHTYNSVDDKVFGSFFKDTLFKKLASESGYTREDFGQTLEYLVFVHFYLVSANDLYSPESVLTKMKEALPPLETLQMILKRCTEVEKIKESA